MHAQKSRYLKGRSISRVTRLSIIIFFRMCTNGQDRFEPSACPRAVTRFCFPENIEGQAARLFNELKEAKYFCDLDAATFSHKAAHFLAELNAIHASREGNGRSQLTVLALVASHAGQSLDLERLEPDEMLAAMIASFDGEEGMLIAIIEKLIH